MHRPLISMSFRSPSSFNLAITESANQLIKGGMGVIDVLEGS